MKSLLLITASIALLSACTMATVSTITLPHPTTLVGTVSEAGEESFILTDHTGSIEVEWEGEIIRPSLYTGEQIAVSGVLDEDASLGETAVVAEEMDAYCIRRQNGIILKAVPLCPLGDGTR